MEKVQTLAAARRVPKLKGFDNWLVMLMSLDRHKEDVYENRVKEAIYNNSFYELIHLRKNRVLYFVDDGGSRRGCQEKFMGQVSVPCEVTVYEEGG